MAAFLSRLPFVGRTDVLARRGLGGDVAARITEGLAPEQAPASR